MARSKRRRRDARAAPPPPPAPPAPVERTWTPSPIVVRLAGPLVIAVAGLVMLAHTWRTWPDPLIDFGRELYLAWQVAEGKTLYADVAHFNGPLSVYLNALVFRVFGPGILTLALANAVLAAGCVAMLYVLIARTADRLGAAVAGLTFVLVFACSRYVRLGNYNWLCPYSYELTHGVALGVAALWCLDRYHRTRHAAWIAATGAGLGLVALTKTEALLAGVLAVATGLVLTLASERPSAARLARLAAAFGAGLATPLALAFVHFVRHMPVADVLAWPLGYWRAASRPEFAAMPFYREGLGLDDVAGNLSKLAVAAVGYVVVLTIAVAAGFVVRVGRWSALVGGVLAAAVFGTALGLLPMAAWIAAARPLTIAMLLVVAVALADWIRVRRDPERAARATLRAALGILALGLLLKLGINVRVFHYGFALAMPATLLFVAALVTWIPAAVTRAGGDGRIVRALVLGLVAAGLVAHVALAERLLDNQTTRLGAGADALLADDRGAPLALALAEIERRVRPDQTLVAFPEGVMLNYLARRASSLPYPQFSPVTLLLWDKERMKESFDRHPPDFVLLVHRENTHEGARFFGRDYGRGLMRRVEEGYRPVWQTGAPPLRDGRFGIVLLERVTASPSDSP
jgi:4-amino-4-deoxy-L-arabinose transferase-like glycosyltransferase